jgi:SagB-type dehydrogenase family enzyme
MFIKKIHQHIEYHIASRNNKVFLSSKTDHLKHYDESIVKTQKDVGLKNYNGKETKLLDPILLKMNFHNLMENRKSARDFDNYEISLAELSTLIYYTCGYKVKDRGRKHTPSSGGFNSVEIFPLVLSSKEVDPGLYYFESQKNCLKEIYINNFQKWLSEDVFYQKEWAKASVVFIITSNIGRLASKYYLRSYRLGLLDVGHVSQNFYLTATAMDLKVCASAGYIESEIESAININGIEIASFLTVMIGK